MQTQALTGSLTKEDAGWKYDTMNQFETFVENVALGRALGKLLALIFSNNKELIKTCR